MMLKPYIVGISMLNDYLKVTKFSLQLFDVIKHSCNKNKLFFDFLFQFDNLNIFSTNSARTSLSAYCSRGTHLKNKTTKRYS